MAKQWERLARFLNADAEKCVCSDAQLANVGCDCDAQQNMPIGCQHCGGWLRSEQEIELNACRGCQ